MNLSIEYGLVEYGSVDTDPISLNFFPNIISQELNTKFALMQITLLKSLGLVISSALMLGLAFPFTGSLFPLAFVAFVPLLLVNFQLDKMNKGRFWTRFGLNYFSFLVFNLMTTWWIYHASAEGMIMGICVNSLLMILPIMLTGFLSRQLGENKGLIAFLVLWLSYEWCQFYWEISWPWLNLGHFLGEYPKIIQWYEYSGTSGGSLWILTVNIFIYLVVRNLYIRKEKLLIQTPIFLFTGIAILFPVISSFIIYYSYQEKDDPVDIVIVQPNIDPYTEKFSVSVNDQLEKMLSLARLEITENTDLILCPETALPVSDMDEGRIENHRTIIRIKSFLDSNSKPPMIIGANSYKIFREENSPASFQVKDYWLETYNSALMVNVHQSTQIYNKSKLVLGAEKIPFVTYFPFLKKYSVELGGTSGVLGMGEGAKNFEGSGIQFGTLICFESVYGDYASYFVRKGADVLCVITNDGWWKDTPGHKQHRMFSRIRAIENRRSVARSANTGISCFIDQRGDVIKEIGWNEDGVIRAEINRNKEFTFFTKYGDLIGRISVFMTLLLIIYGVTELVKKIRVDK